MGEPHTTDRCREKESEGLFPDEDEVCKAVEQAPVCVCVKFVLLSLVSFGTDAGVSAQLIHTLSSILTAVLLTVIVV